MDNKEVKKNVKIYYVNNRGVHKDIGEECKGIFFISIYKAIKYWKSKYGNIEG